MQTLAFDYLDAPVAVVGSRNWITPAAEMEELYFPQNDWIIDAIHERILPLPAIGAPPPRRRENSCAVAGQASSQRWQCGR